MDVELGDPATSYQNQIKYEQFYIFLVDKVDLFIIKKDASCRR